MQDNGCILLRERPRNGGTDSARRSGHDHHFIGQVSIHGVAVWRFRSLKEGFRADQESFVGCYFFNRKNWFPTADLACGLVSPAAFQVPSTAPACSRRKLAS